MTNEHTTQKEEDQHACQRDNQNEIREQHVITQDIILEIHHGRAPAQIVHWQTKGTVALERLIEHVPVLVVLVKDGMTRFARHHRFDSLTQIFIVLGLLILHRQSLPDKPVNIGMHDKRTITTEHHAIAMAERFGIKDNLGNNSHRNI